jgi:hypothetical protein
MIITTIRTNVTITPEGPLKRTLQQSLPVHLASVPAKKRGRTIVKSISIKPPDYVRSASKANGFAIDAIKKDAEAMFTTPTPVHLASEPAKKRRRTIMKSISIKPSDYVRSAFKANGFAIDQIKKDAEAMFTTPTQEMIAAYIPEVLDAVRKNDLKKVKELHKAGILTINGCNKFGESTLHLACRRGYTDIVRYLLDEVKVDVNMRDDYYRTPLHDACWTTAPEFDLVELFLSRAPHQLLMQDVRGFTPFDYVRGEHNGKWLRFLWERKAILRPLDKPNTDDIATAFALASLRN